MVRSQAHSFKKIGYSHIVDGQSAAIGIAKLFADKNRDLYSSVPYDINDMQWITTEANELLANDSSITDCISNIRKVNDIADIFKGKMTSSNRLMTLCFFNKVNSNIKCKLFLSYCMILYGYELCLLSNDYINNLCVSSRKCTRFVLQYTHCFLLRTPVSVSTIRWRDP